MKLSGRRINDAARLGARLPTKCKSADVPGTLVPAMISKFCGRWMCRCHRCERGECRQLYWCR